MDYMFVALAPGVGQLINDLAESLGCDYGPVLGILIAVGLDRHARVTGDEDLRGAALRQYLHSVKGAGALGLQLSIPLVVNNQPPF